MKLATTKLSWFQACRRRRGMTAVLAMLYLTLMSSLAVGFYAMVNTSTVMSHNEQHSGTAMSAAESMQSYVRYHMAALVIPQAVHSDEQLTYEELFNDLYNALADAPDLEGNVPTDAHITQPDGTVHPVIYIPGRPAGREFITYMKMHGSENLEAYAEITRLGGFKYRVKTVGVYNRDKSNEGGRKTNEVRRAIEITYARAEKASKIFNYGVASKSPILLKGQAEITGNPESLGSVLAATDAATPLTMDGSPSISGHFSYSNPASQPEFGNGTIAGMTQSSPGFEDVIHPGTPSPPFPEIDTTIFYNYVTANSPTLITTGNPNNATYTNIIIEPNTNPTFNSDVVLNGVVYVRAPNNVTFSGGATINGVIVVENDPAGGPMGTTLPNGSTGRNQLKFRGNVEQNPPPPGSGALNHLTGSAILAPGFHVTFAGGFISNSGAVAGSVIASSIDFAGGADVRVKGSVINLDENTATNLVGNSSITIESTGTTNFPAGVYFGNNYKPLPDMYREVMPYAQ